MSLIQVEDWLRFSVQHHGAEMAERLSPAVRQIRLYFGRQHGNCWLRTSAAGEGKVDPLSRKLLQELEEMQQRTGRMLRNMSMSRMLSMESGTSQPPVDIYESEGEYIVYADLAGVDSRSFSVVVDGHHVRIHGKRQLPPHKNIACVHQLEIEAGVFDRTVNLPGAVAVDEVTSTYINGILRITLPKRQAVRCRINIAITDGGE